MCLYQGAPTCERLRLSRLSNNGCIYFNVRCFKSEQSALRNWEMANVSHESSLLLHNNRNLAFRYASMTIFYFTLAIFVIILAIYEISTFSNYPIKYCYILAYSQKGNELYLKIITIYSRLRKQVSLYNLPHLLPSFFEH